MCNMPGPEMSVQIKGNNPRSRKTHVANKQIPNWECRIERGKYTFSPYSRYFMVLLKIDLKIKLGT